MRFASPAAALVFTAMFASGASAIDLPGTALSLSATAAVVSDYRYHGISQTRNKPALQLGLSLTHNNGFYVGLWGSTIDLYDDGPDFDGGKDFEIDYYGGWSGNVGSEVTIDTSVTYYSYPGVMGPTNYAEAQASVAFSLGRLGAKLGGSYFPDQKAVPDAGGHLFGELSGDVHGLFKLTGEAGRQFYGVHFGPETDYWEWSLAASRKFGPIEASLAYIDTNLPSGSDAGATVVASLGVSF